MRTEYTAGIVTRWFGQWFRIVTSRHLRNEWRVVYSDYNLTINAGGRFLAIVMLPLPKGK